jgi:hypothetical protein
MGQMTGEVSEQWMQGGWDTTRVTVIDYSGTSIVEETYRTRSRSEGVWRDSSVSFLRRDDADNVYLSEQKYWTNGVLTWMDRQTNMFDGNMRLVRTTAEMLMQGALVPTDRVTFTYDHLGNELKRVGEAYGNGVWNPAWQLTSTYDGSRNILTCKTDEWAGSAWVPSIGTTITDGYASVFVADAAGNSSGFWQFATLAFDYGGSPAGVPGEGAERPGSWELLQNYPNPFNPATTIRYGLPVEASVTLTVFDALGQQVAVLDDGVRSAGYHEVMFDGARLPSGVYFYRLRSGSFVETKKLILVR